MQTLSNTAIAQVSGGNSELLDVLKVIPIVALAGVGAINVVEELMEIKLTSMEAITVASLTGRMVASILESLNC